METNFRERLFYIMDPSNDRGGNTGKAYDAYQISLILLSLVPLFFPTRADLFVIPNIVFSALFLIDYAVRWITADYKLKRSGWSFLIYPFTPWAVIDMLAIIPIFTTLNKSLLLLRVLRLLRLFRIFKVLRYSRHFTIFVRVFRNCRKSLGVLLAVSLGYVLITALIILNVEPATFPDIFDALYWSVTVLTTVGYGDLYPISDVGRAISMISSFVGIAIVALPSGIITAGFVEELNEEKRKEVRNDNTSFKKN